MLNKRSAIRLALIQVGVIVSGILAATVGYHAAGGRTGFVPDSTAFLVHFGVLLVGLPLGWLTAVVRVRKNPAFPHLKKVLALGSGIALIVALTLFSAYAAGKPWIGSTRWIQTG